MVIDPLFHFSDTIIAAVHSTEQRDWWRKDKPSGLWVSVEGNGDGWSDWCASEDFGIGAVPHVVHLHPEANILRIANGAELIAFHREFHIPSGNRFREGREIDWITVAKRWQGIIIAPYVWSARLSVETAWYYGWDCASGCIWDAAAVDDILAIPVPEKQAAE